MIRRFCFRNFCCFKEGVEIDFALGNGVPEDVRMGRTCATVMGIKGANGSGKTNILKALGWLKFFCTKSADHDVSDTIDIDTFFDNKDNTDFYLEFETQGTAYVYQLTLSNKQILSERIQRKREGGRKTQLLLREKNTIQQVNSELAEIKSIELRSDASVISSMKKYKFKSEMDDLEAIYAFFIKIITNVNKFGYVDLQLDLNETCRQYLVGRGRLDFAKKIIAEADNSLVDIEIKDRIDENDNVVYYPVFIHSNQGVRYSLRFSDESSGTKALFKKLNIYSLVLNSGGFLAMDEFDTHLHAMVLPVLIDLFQNPETNPHGAQLLFTAHNTEVIDKLGKYRTILVNKEDGESYCYRLDEISGSMIRNDRPISPLYLDGKIGGVPVELVREGRA